MFLNVCSTAGPSCWHIVDDGVYGISLSGVRQSPINIETSGAVVETDESLDELKYEYVPENCTQVGNTGASVGVDDFGASAPANILYEKYGITADAVVQAAKGQM